jgi:TonB family protein
MQIDGDAQSGNDGFNIGAGKGGGMAGSGGGGLGAGTYKQYLAGVFQRLLREDPELRKKAYAVQADVWLSAEGQVTRVELAKSSGDSETDAQVLAALRVPHAAQRVPASVSMPVRLSLKGRRPD